MEWVRKFRKAGLVFNVNTASSQTADAIQLRASTDLESGHARLSAAARVFNIVELLENILAQVDPRKLLAIQQVNRYFHNVIKHSPMLQQSLWFIPTPSMVDKPCISKHTPFGEDDPFQDGLNPHLVWLSYRRESLMVIKRGTAYDNSKNLVRTISVAFKPYRDTKPSWCKMLVYQPQSSTQHYRWSMVPQPQGCLAGTRWRRWCWCLGYFDTPPTAGVLVKLAAWQRDKERVKDAIYTFLVLMFIASTSFLLVVGAVYDLMKRLCRAIKAIRLA